MESFEFGLVRKLCRRRNQLIRSYPSTVAGDPLLHRRARGFRHGRLKLWLGTWLYWLIGSFFTRPPRLLSVATIAREEPILDRGPHRRRLRVLRRLPPRQRRALRLELRPLALEQRLRSPPTTSSRCGARRDATGSGRRRRATSSAGATVQIRSRVLVNACGPFVDAHNALHRPEDPAPPRVLQGHPPDRRRGSRRTGGCSPSSPTTAGCSSSSRWARAPASAPPTRASTSPDTRVTDEDRDFVLDNINKRLKLPKPLTERDIIAERCGVRPLVVRGEGGGERDWLQLSRKHVVEVDAAAAHVSIFGGKLTDCLNVGDEVAGGGARSGVELPFPQHRWYGEPRGRGARRVLPSGAAHGPRRADRAGVVRAAQPRLWRRYGARAFLLLEDIRRDPRKAEVLIEGTEYIRCELKDGAARDDRQARRLPAPPLEDRAGRPRAARSAARPGWSRPAPSCSATTPRRARRVLRHNRMLIRRWRPNPAQACIAPR